MTAPDPTTRAEDGAGRDYVLIKRGLYWRPGAQGYTGLLSEAGRYSAADAAAYAAHDNDSTRAWPADEAREFAPACWQETMLAFRTRQRQTRPPPTLQQLRQMEQIPRSISFNSSSWMRKRSLILLRQRIKLDSLILPQSSVTMMT